MDLSELPYVAPKRLYAFDELGQIFRSQMAIMSIVGPSAAMAGRSFDLRFRHATSVHFGSGRMPKRVW